MLREAFTGCAFGIAVLGGASIADSQTTDWRTAIAEAQAPVGEAENQGSESPQPPAQTQTQPSTPPPPKPTTPAPTQPAEKGPASPPEPVPAAQPKTSAPPPAAGAPIELPPIRIIQTPPSKVKPPKQAIRPRKQAPLVRAAVPETRQRPLLKPMAAPATRPAAAAPAPEAQPQEAESQAQAEENTVAMTPVKGSEIPLDKVPSAVSQVSSREIEKSGSPAIQDALQQYVPGAIISDANGNPFQTDIQYRGFTASPVEGTPQGLAAYQNGVRINEVFGDTVNWDLIPTNAIKNIALLSGNPLYGLNALGGALNISMKDGFGFQGVESDTRAGSYGRGQELLQLGKEVDNFAAYAAIDGIWDGGWREFSPSEVRRAYLDLGVKDKDTEFHINFTGATNTLGAVGPTPVQLLAQNYSAVYTNPQTTDNELAMVSMNGSVKLTDTLTLSGVAYLRSFHQSHTDGNVSSVAPCNLLNGGTGYDPGSLLCLETSTGTIVPVTNQFGNTITTGKYYGPNDTIGEIDYTTNNTNSVGTSLQATDKDTLFGLKNIFIAGASIDHGDVRSTSDAELGTLNTQNLVVTANGLYVLSPLDLAPIDLKTTTNYYGLFFTDTVDITTALSATIGGRYNYEDLSLNDLTGTTLTGDHIYTRFNPMTGFTYKFDANVSAYGGYAEANRAPTPAELSCASPAQPCLLQNFLITDPNLKQVVSKTWQGGFRGGFNPFGYGHLDWTAGIFHTENFNDIINVTDPVIRTRGYFQNAGNSLREGAEASLRYSWKALTLHANYAYVDATFLNLSDDPFSEQSFRRCQWQYLCASQATEFHLSRLTGSKRVSTMR